MPNNMLTAMDIFPSAQERQQVQNNALNYQNAKQAQDDQEQLRNSIMSRRPQAPQQVGDSTPSNAENMNAMSGVPSSVPKSASMNEMKWQSQSRPEPQSVFDIKADEFWAQQQQKQASDVIQAAAPELKIAAETGNDSVRAMFAEQMQKKYEQTGNEGFKNVADLYSRLKFEPNGDSIYNGKVEGPMGKKLLETWRMKAKDPAQLAILDSIQDGDDVKVTVNKDKGLTVDHRAMKGKGTMSTKFVTNSGKPVSVVTESDGEVSYKDMNGNDLGEDDVRMMTPAERSSGMGGALGEFQIKAGVDETGELVFSSRRGGAPYKYDAQGHKVAPKGIVMPQKEAVAMAETKPGDVRSPGQKIADLKAGTQSQAFQKKALDVSKGYIQTIDYNIDQLNDHITAMATRHNLDRNVVMNWGMRKYLQIAVADGDVNIYDMLVGAVSQETGKLQNGGAGSVAQLNQGAADQMKKIHYENLPVSSMVKLMGATRQEGQNRVDAMTKIYDQSRKEVGGRDNKQKEMTQPEIKAAVIQTAKEMKPGISKRATFNGREATITKNQDGSVSVSFSK